jgi:hypothetical protein
LSGCYERGGERTGAGTGTVATWRRREGAVRSVWHAHEQGPSAGSGASTTEVSSGQARGAEERRGSGQVGPIWKREGRVGHAWNTWVGRGEGRSWGGPERTSYVKGPPNVLAGIPIYGSGGASYVNSKLQVYYKRK